MSKRSKSFRKKYENNGIKINENYLKSNKNYNSNKKIYTNNENNDIDKCYLNKNNNYVFNKKSCINNRISEINEYSILSNVFCSILGLTKEELKSFIKNETIPPFRKDYMIIKKDVFDKIQSSLSKAFKAGEDKEHERHFKEEKEAFERGIKYGQEQMKNKVKNAASSLNDIEDKDIFIVLLTLINSL